MQVTKEDLKVGMTIYRVYSLGEGSFIEKLQVTSEPYIVELCGEEVSFIEVSYESSFEKGVYRKAEVSLRDAFIEPNTYNNHVTFDCEPQAKRYLSHCKNGGTRNQWLAICDNFNKTWGRA